MKRSLKERIIDRIVLARARLKKRFGGEAHEILVTGRGFGGLQRILLFVPPEEAAFELVDGLGTRLRQQCPEAALDLVVARELRPLYRKTAWAGKVYALDVRSFTMLGAPSPPFLEKLKNEHYELVIDLNRPLILPVANLAGCFGQAYRAGVKSEYSSLFYNIEMVPQDRLTAEAVIRVLQVL